MPSGQIVEIKVKPYLKDYYIQKFGGQEPIPATTANKVFPLLAQYLTHKPKSWTHPKSQKDNLLFELPYNEVLDVRDLCYISEAHLPEISNYFYGLFYTDYIAFMNNMVISQRCQIKYAIMSFMDKKSIPWGHVKDHYWTLHKIYYRYRKEYEKHEKKVPQFSE